MKLMIFASFCNPIIPNLIFFVSSFIFKTLFSCMSPSPVGYCTYQLSKIN